MRKKNISFAQIIDMCERLAEYYNKIGESEKATVQLQMAKEIILATKNDLSTAFTRNLYETFKEKPNSIEQKLMK